MPNNETIDIAAPFSVRAPEGEGPHSVLDANGVLVATCPDRGLAHVLAYAISNLANEAKDRQRELVHVLSFVSDHPQGGGKLELRLPALAPEGTCRDQYTASAIAAFRRLLDGMERRLRARCGVPIGDA